jgi:outer membrane protein insertion porin family
VPASYGVTLGLFTDFGTLGRIDNVIRACTPNTVQGQGTCVKDNLAFRATGGVSFQWRSPFGPIQIDLAVPYIKTKYDRAQIIHFSTATGF